MRKILLIIVLPILLVTIGFFIGNIFLKPVVENKNEVSQNHENIRTENYLNEVKNNEIAVNTTEEKISINTNMKKITFYNNCNHQLEIIINDKDKYINMTKERLQQEFPDWEIKEFNQENVILYKEENDFCNEHFLAKDEDGYITIYTIDNEENILELLDKTDISTKYLTRNRSRKFKKRNSNLH